MTSAHKLTTHQDRSLSRGMNVGIGLALVACAAFAVSCSRPASSDAATPAADPSAAPEAAPSMAQLVQYFNEGLPRQLNEQTRLDRFTLEGQVGTYNYSMVRPDGSPSLNAQELDELRSNAFAANLKAGYCGDTPMEYLRERGYSIRYLYVSATKAVLAEHMFSPQSCAS